MQDVYRVDKVERSVLERQRRPVVLDWIKKRTLRTPHINPQDRCEPLLPDELGREPSGT